MQISDFFIPGDVLEDDSDFDNIPGTQIQREREGGGDNELFIILVPKV